MTPKGVLFSDSKVGGIAGEWAEPKKGGAAYGTLLYLHGGGYVSMSPRTHRSIAGDFALRGFRVFTPDYRLAPEHIFPAALEDVTAVWRGLRAQVEGPIFVAGDSSGGGLATALLLSLRDKGDQGPTAACLFSPWADLACTGESLRLNRDRDPMQATNCIEMLATTYVGQADPRSPFVSPVYGDFTGLPPLLIFAGDTEVLLDDAKRLAERAASQGVSSNLRIYPKMPHAWPLLSAILPEGRQAVDEAAAFLREAAPRFLGDWLRSQRSATPQPAGQAKTYMQM
jgi:monoterpene epsilon-lactone hydrolase